VFFTDFLHESRLIFFFLRVHFRHICYHNVSNQDVPDHRS